MLLFRDRVQQYCIQSFDISLDTGKILKYDISFQNQIDSYSLNFLGRHWRIQRNLNLKPLYNKVIQIKVLENKNK